jgi:capsular exopolysaccharide synthesis family protein
VAKKQKASKNLLEVQNAAKTLFANIRFQSIDSPLSSIALTSSVPDEGKTTTAWYLAQAMATAGNEVLLVEADMRRRSLANMLQIHPSQGLFSVLSGKANVRDVMVPTSVKGLYFLDSEPSIPNPPDVLASKRMRMLNESLAKEFDYIIYDTPPVGTFVDAAVLGTIVDGVVLVSTPQELVGMIVEKALKMTDLMNIPVLGLVENMSYITCPDCGKKYELFGKSRKDDIARQYNIPLTAGLPIDPKLAGSVDKGLLELFEGDWLDAVADRLLEGLENDAS